MCLCVLGGEGYKHIALGITKAIQANVKESRGGNLFCLDH